MTFGRSISMGLVGEKPQGFSPTLSVVVWDLITGLVRQGHTAEAGIDRIYAVHGGQASVTSIINGLKRDRKIGTLNPNLRIKFLLVYVHTCIF
jgi:hypothetical protein